MTRGNLSSARLRALALLGVLVATPAVWLHTGGDDDQILGARSHPRSVDVHAAGLTADATLTPGSAHCFLCHTLRSMQMSRPAVAPVMRAAVSSLRETPVVVLHGADARLLPPRSPPL